MKIKVEFDRDLPDGIIEKLMENPDYSMSDLGLDRYDDYLQAMVIAVFAKGNEDATMSQLREWAADDVAGGIEEYFFSYMCKDYTEGYQDQIREASVD